jgi:hypothetical protein
VSQHFITAGEAIVPTLQFNTQYITRVRAKVAGEWGNYGALCTLGLGSDPAIVGVLPTHLRDQFCNTTLPLNTTIACNPVAMGSLYEFEFTDQANFNLINVVSSLIYLNLASVSPNLQVGHTYAVRARGLVYNTWSNYGTACNITIGSPIVGAGSRGSSPDETNSEVTIETSHLENNMGDQLLAYPNPFDLQSGFIIKSAENKYVTVNLFDAVGQMVWSRRVNTNNYEQFNTQDLAPGLYFMSTSENKNNSVRVIKSK